MPAVTTHSLMRAFTKLRIRSNFLYYNWDSNEGFPKSVEDYVKSKQEMEKLGILFPNASIFNRQIMQGIRLQYISKG